MAAEPAAPVDSQWHDQLLRDPHQVLDKQERVRRMFAAIAPSYDLNNHLHSLWLDHAWRRKAVRLAGVQPGDRIVDVACGTGDLLYQFQRALAATAPTSPAATLPLIGVDFTFEMLPIARRKNRGERIAWLNGDAQALPLPDQSADVVSIAFGIRNVQDPAAALAEFRRILKPGGRLVVLEFSLPVQPLLRRLYNFYFQQVLPRTATLISGDRTGAYRYLPSSVNTFIPREKMLQLIQQAGFQNASCVAMTFGICVCYVGMVSNQQSLPS